MSEYTTMRVMLTASMKSMMDRMSDANKAIVGESIVTTIDRIGEMAAGERVTNIAKVIHSAMDDMVAKSVMEDFGGSDVKCSRGCSHCCKIHVDVTTPEAELLVRTAKQNNVPIDLAKLQRQAKHGVEDWHELAQGDRACVFNAPDGACLVYKDRPGACRRYMVVSEPERCDQTKYRGEEVLVFASIRAEMLDSAVINAFKGGSMAKMLLAAAEEDQKVVDHIYGEWK